MTQSKERTNIKIAKLEARTASARRDLHTAWDARGYTDPVVLAASPKMDAFCNEYQRLLDKPPGE